MSPTLPYHIFHLKIRLVKIKKRVNCDQSCTLSLRNTLLDNLLSWKVLLCILFFKVAVSWVSSENGLNWIWTSKWDRTIIYFLIFLTIFCFPICFYFSSNLSEKFFSPFQEVRMRKDKLCWFSSRFLESIHIQLHNQKYTCLMKLLTFRCLKYFGSTISSNISGSLIMNSLPLVRQCMICEYY